MKRRGAMLVLLGIMVFGVFLMSCAKLGETDDMVRATSDTGLGFFIPVTIESLWAGQTTFVGTVTASLPMGQDTLFITYKLISPYTITELHSDWGWSLSDIPQKNGNPIPGKFRWKAEDLGGITEYTFKEVVTLPSSGEIPETLYDANHGVTGSETFWGGNARWKFPGKKWAYYFPKKTYKSPKLPEPDFEVTAIYDFDSPDAWWEVNLSGIGEKGSVPYNVWDDEIVLNGTWLSWCIDEYVNMNDEAEFEHVTLMNCLDEDLPTEYQSDHWNNINYMINHKNGAGASSIQRAVWYFIGGKPNRYHVYPPTTSKAYALIVAAETYGNDFVPGPGQWAAVAVINHEEGAKFQRSIIEVDP